MGMQEEKEGDEEGTRFCLLCRRNVFCSVGAQYFQFKSSYDIEPYTLNLKSLEITIAISVSVLNAQSENPKFA